MANPARFSLGNTGMRHITNNERLESAATGPRILQGGKCGRGHARTPGREDGTAGRGIRNQGNDPGQDARVLNRDCSERRPGETLIALRRVPTGMWAPVFWRSTTDLRNVYVEGC